MKLKVGDTCPCHGLYQKKDSPYRREIKSIDHNQRHITCGLPGAMAMFAGTRANHWFDEVAWAIRQHGRTFDGFEATPVEFNDLGEVTP